MIGTYLDLSDSTRQRLIRHAEEQAEREACSCVVRHASVETASARVRRRLACAEKGDQQ